MSIDQAKVLFCAFEVVPAPTGFSARATEFIRGLNRDFTVDALTAKSPDQSHIERYHGARLLRVPVGGGDLPQRGQAFQRAVRRQLESDEYQLVQFSDPYGGYALSEARAQYGFKLVFDVVGFTSVDIRYTHPHLVDDPRFLAKLRRQELYCLMNADAVLVSSEVAASYVASLGVDRPRIAIVRNSVDPSLFPKEQMEEPNRTPMRLLYLGSQAMWQGLPALIRAVSIANQTVDVRLSIVGQRHTPWRLQLEEMIRELKLSAKVELGNPVGREQLPSVMKAADVGVAPLAAIDRNVMQGASLNKIAHYLAAGRPVIAGDLAVCREFLDERCAVFAKAGDENDLARAICELAKDPGRRASMGEAARARAEQQFHANDPRRILSTLYQSLIDRPSKAPATNEDSEGASRSQSEPTNLVVMSDPPTDVHRAPERSAGDPRTDENRIPVDESPTEIRAIAEQVTDPKMPFASGPPVVVRGQMPQEAREPSDEKLPVIAGKPVPPDASLEADLSALMEPAAAPAAKTLPSGAPVVKPSGSAPKPVTTPTSSPATPIIASGAPPPVPDEWIGHLVFGYAPPADGRPAATLAPAKPNKAQ